MPKTSVVGLLYSVVLAGCVTDNPMPPYDGSIAPPQVAYRIDDHRYFEVVPKEDMACARARLFYVDSARGIRTNVTSWDRTQWGRLVIDASTDRYLITPIIGMDPDCQTGDYASTMCKSRLRYSVDGGRTWHATLPAQTEENGDVYLVGDSVYYAGQRAQLAELASVGDSAWTVFPLGGLNRLPALLKPPIDNETHCDKSKAAKTRE